MHVAELIKFIEKRLSPEDSWREEMKGDLDLTNYESNYMVSARANNKVDGLIYVPMVVLDDRGIVLNIARHLLSCCGKSAIPATSNVLARLDEKAIESFHAM